MNDSSSQAQSLMSQAIKAMRENNLSEAIELSAEMLEIDPNHAGANAVAFTSLFKSDKFEQARRIGGRAAELNPKSEFILNNQACLQLEAKQPAAAAGLLKSLIEQYGETAQWMYNLGLAQRMVGSYQNSVSAFQRTLDLEPEHDKAAFQLAELYSLTGQLELAARQYNYLRLLRPRHAPAHSQYIHHYTIAGEASATDLNQEVALWGERFIPKDKSYPQFIEQHADKLKVGFVVGVIPTSYWSAIVMPLLNELSADVEIVVYWHDTHNKALHLEPDVTVVNSSGLNDAEFARQIRSDQIDTVVDIGGIQVGCRQRVLGMQVARRQFGWLVHQGTFASNRITILDEQLGSQRFCFDLIDDFDEVNGDSERKMLFAINTNSGLSESTIQTWAQILDELDGWSLNLDATQPAVQNELRLRFAKYQINAPQIGFDPESRPNKGDVVLENLTNNGVVNTYTALRRGAAVVALHGELFPAQQSSALLTQAGRGDWVVGRRSRYKSKVLQLIADGGIESISDTQFKQSQLHSIGEYAKRMHRILAGESAD
ncbi:MAG: tetratricopeptide repeat protein [Pseudomonadota bacterium]